MKKLSREIGVEVVGGLITLAILAVAAWVVSKAVDAHVSAFLWILTIGSASVAAIAVTAWLRSKRSVKRERAAVARERKAASPWSGLTEATGLVEYEPELEGSQEHPRAKLGEIQQFLDFMGHGASKWTNEPTKMAEMLGRSKHLEGKVRMLLMDPGSTTCENASRRRCKGDAAALPRKILGSLMTLKTLGRDNPNLEVRLYDHRPHFRLTFVDRRTVIVGHYREYTKDSEYTPLLVWECGPDYPWSFYAPFIGYFEQEWERAGPINWERIDKLARKLNVSTGDEYL